MEKVGLLRIFKRSIEKIVVTGIAKAVQMFTVMRTRLLNKSVLVTTKAGR